MHQVFCRSIQACPITFAIPGLHNKLLKPLATSILKKTYWLEKLETNLHASDTTPQYANTAVVELQSPCRRVYLAEIEVDTIIILSS